MASHGTTNTMGLCKPLGGDASTGSAPEASAAQMSHVPSWRPDAPSPDQTQCAPRKLSRRSAARSVHRFYDTVVGVTLHVIDMGRY